MPITLLTLIIATLPSTTPIKINTAPLCINPIKPITTLSQTHISNKTTNPFTWDSPSTNQTNPSKIKKSMFIDANLLLSALFNSLGFLPLMVSIQIDFVDFYPLDNLSHFYQFLSNEANDSGGFYELYNVEILVLQQNQFLQRTTSHPRPIVKFQMGKKHKSLNQSSPSTQTNTNKQPSPASNPNLHNNQNASTSNPIKHTKPIQKQPKPISPQPNQSNPNTNKNQHQKIVNPNKQSQNIKTPKVPQVKGKLWSQLQYTLRTQIVQSLHKSNFKTMLPVQQASIPLLLKNYDLAVQAQTGSGKTLSFLIPLLQKYLAINISTQKKYQDNDQDETKEFRPFIKYLIISPTRELCQQTFNVLNKLLNNLPSKQRSQKYLKYCHCATGGSDMATDIEKLKDSTIVFVGTIGRIRQLSEHMDQNWLKKVEYLFIDEADRVLKQKGIEQLIRSVQKIRRTAMFSATLQTLNEKNFQFYGMRNLAKISLKQTGTPSPNSPSSGLSSSNEDKKYIIPKSLTNTYLKMPSRNEKMQFLVNFLKNHIEQNKIIVFFNTCASVDFYTKIFNAFFKLNQEQEIVGLHGRLKTNRRQKLIRNFMKRSNGCLFATDVVSRGIDFDHIHFIVQIDPPEDPDNYVHRIGRTARINRPGTAILLIEQHEEAFINYLAEKSVGVQEISDPKHYYSKNDEIQKIDQIGQKVDYIMRTDRDFVEKSKKAFVSYIRSYKEHDLRYIFEFKHLNIGMTAKSFFMYRIPRVKEILGKSISSFTQSTVDIESIPWLDKNQQLQYMKKKEKRDAQLLEKKKLEKKILKNADAKNNKSKRKRIKAKMQNQFMSNLNKEHRDILKSRLQGGKKGKHEDQESAQQVSDYDYNDSEDTQQIEERMKNGKNSDKKDQPIVGSENSKIKKENKNDKKKSMMIK